MKTQSHGVPESESGERRLRRDRETVVVDDAQTADHDRTKPCGDVAAATVDAGEQTAGEMLKSATDAGVGPTGFV
jgi:hypothetical protein